jgi:hypothetical protein
VFDREGHFCLIDPAGAEQRPWRSKDVGRRRERCEEDAGRSLRWREGLARPSSSVQLIEPTQKAALFAGAAASQLD